MRHALLVFAMVGLAAPASPCSVVGPLPPAERLVGDADVIALVRAEGAFDDMPVVAYIQNDEADEDLAPFGPKPVRWVASSKDDLSAFPNDVKTRIGGALWDAQIGLKSAAAKPLKGFGDAGVLEVVVDFDGNTFRTVYTVRFAKAVYVLHAFQKKSRRASATPKSDLDLIGTRLARAKEDYEAWLGSR